MGVVVAVGVVFEEGDSGLLEDDDRSVLEVVVVVVSFLPSPFVFLVLLDFIEFRRSSRDLGSFMFYIFEMVVTELVYGGVIW